MSWNRVVSELNKKLPDFNDDLLIGYKRRNIDRSKDFMSEVFIAGITSEPVIEPPRYDFYRRRAPPSLPSGLFFPLGFGI